MANFFSRLSYSFGNEDWEIEKKALSISPKDRAVCITASGDRPLHLLLSGCKEVVSIDANRIQNYMLDLKVAAIKTLDYNEYLNFLGAVPCAAEKRLTLFEKIIPQLEGNALLFWTNNPVLIKKGVLYQGNIEKWGKRLSRFLNVAQGKMISNLFACKSIEEQRELLEKNWNDKRWMKISRFLLNPLFARLFIQDPGLYEHLPPSLKVGEYIYKRLRSSLEVHLAKENALLSLYFKGSIDKAAFPPYLSKKGHQYLPHLLDKLSSHTIDAISFLEICPNESFDIFSLSDVASYLNKRDFHKLLVEIERTAKPGARFCLRQFLSNHQIPPHLASHFQRNGPLEQELENEDRCFVYRFMAGTIEKSALPKKRNTLPSKIPNRSIRSEIPP